jgi:plastocyanin
MRQRLSRMACVGIGVGVCVLVLGLGLTGCSSTSPGETRAGAVVRVTERDFRIAVAPARVRAGDVRLFLRNKGPDAHELIMVRASHGRLPLRTDGMTVDEEALAAVKTIEAQPPGATHELRLHLKPGRYELYCNMAGHYLGGMRAILMVT